MSETPASLGYRMPAEWEPHEATWLAWPHEKEDWPGKFDPIPWVYAEIVRLLTRAEPVWVVVDRKTRNEAQSCLEQLGVDLARVQFFEARTDRVWLRDSAPGFVVREPDESSDSPPLALVDWRFNAWAKYDNHRRDNRLTRKIARNLGRPRFKPRAQIDGKPVRVVLEGGAIDVNGKGTLLTTEECLLDPEIQVRNPGLDRAGYEQVFADQLGIRKTIWLGRGICGDDTHGHIDDIARFVNPSTIVAAVEDDPNDPNFEPLRENLERLKAATDQDGNPLSIVELPMPDPVLFEGQRLPASYANFYIANGLVLVPTFNDPADREALDTLASLFPDRTVVGIHSVD
ncbi:MAG TPA: agmatine deiminase family protein, partial [Isosphaeraceae bacterium]|nr:agmatine deiminase family protein [Isosphaeraceae bacterium]